MRYVAGMFIGLAMVVVTIMMSGEKGISPQTIAGCLVLNALGIIQLTACTLLAFGQLVQSSGLGDAVKSFG